MSAVGAASKIRHADRGGTAPRAVHCERSNGAGSKWASCRSLSSRRSSAAEPSGPSTSVAERRSYGTVGERSSSASVSSAIARPVASTASSVDRPGRPARVSHASAASNGRASISQRDAMFVNSSRLCPATFFKLRNAVSALPSRHASACLRPVSNSACQGESAGAGSRRIFVRSAAGTPAEPTTDASRRCSSAVPSDLSTIHSTSPWAKPVCPAWAPACTSVAAIRTRSVEISWPATSRALSNCAAASWIRPAIASATDAWPSASGLSGKAARNAWLDAAASANFRVASCSFTCVAMRHARPGVLAASRSTCSSAAEI